MIKLGLSFVTVAAFAALLGFANSPVAFGQAPVFHRMLAVGLKDPVVLDVSISKGDLTIEYNRDGVVSIYASGKDASGRSLTEDFLKSSLIIDKEENHITVRSSASVPDVKSMSYRIDVPFRTQVNSSALEMGNQKLIGITGPAKLESSVGNIDVTYVRFSQVQAITGKGNISCARVAQVFAETGRGNITLEEDGPSEAAVKKGLGRIEISGARGKINASTDGGDLHIKAVLTGNWQLKSVAGSIRIELPPRSYFEINAETTSGGISVERDDMHKPPAESHQLHDQVNGGGTHIEAQTISGNIYIQ